jgi:hypothetical protein
VKLDFKICAALVDEYFVPNPWNRLHATAINNGQLMLAAAIKQVGKDAFI